MHCLVYMVVLWVSKFHNLGAAAAKAQSPRVGRVFFVGDISNNSSFDLEA